MSRPYRPTPDDRARAAALVAARGPEVAFLVHRGVTWVAAGPARPDLGRTPVVDLVQGVREACDDADLVLRRRVLATVVTPLDREVVAVAGRRVTEVVPEGPPAAPGPLRDAVPFAEAARCRAAIAGAVDAGDAPAGGDARAWGAWLDVARGAPADVPARHRDRPEVAVLLGPDGRVLHAARNTSGHNRSLHAEVNLVQGWVARTGGGLPAGAHVVCSLQPCRMCAAFLVAAAPALAGVRYARPDPGRLARDTALARAGLEAPLGPAPTCE